MKEVLFRLSKLFQALGNGIRLQVLRRLFEEEADVGTLAETVDKSIQAVSHHLRILRDNDLVSSRTAGQRRMYRLKRPELVRAYLALADFLERDEGNSG